MLPLYLTILLQHWVIMTFYSNEHNDGLTESFPCGIKTLTVCLLYLRTSLMLLNVICYCISYCVVHFNQSFTDVSGCAQSVADTVYTVLCEHSDNLWQTLYILYCVSTVTICGRHCIYCTV